MWNGLLIACCHAFLFVHDGATASGIPAGLEVTLSSDQKEYLLGEPIALTVGVTNSGKEPIQLVRPLEGYGIVTLLSEDGVNFAEYRMGIFGVGAAQWKPQALQPGETWTLKLRILYRYDRASRLAFERPGTFFIKVQYTLLPHTSTGARPVDSNVLAIEVKRPERVDVDVWKRIRSPDFLYFLQSGLEPEGDKAVPRKAVELLETFPQTTYAGALKHALGEYYRRRRMKMTREEIIEDPQLERIRAVTGIVEPPEGPFPDDRRLDVEITTHFPGWTPWEEVLEEVRRQSGVPLGLAPELREGKTKSMKVTRPLRRFMRSMDAHDRKWLPEGEGYRLVPVPEPKKK